MLGEYMRSVWKRSGSEQCCYCARPIYRDHDSGYWIHAEHGEVDGHNGLYCSSEMWDEPEKRKFAEPWKVAG